MHHIKDIILTIGGGTAGIGIYLTHFNTSIGILAGILGCIWLYYRIKIAKAELKHSKPKDNE